MSLKQLMLSLAPQEGCANKPIEGVEIYRFSKPYERVDGISPAAICFVIQGQKTLYLGDTPIHYDEQNYLINSVKVPVASELSKASQDEPYLGLVLPINSALVNELLMATHNKLSWDESQSADAIVSASPINASLEASIERLLVALHDPLEKEVLGPSLIREIFFHVLRNDKGYLLRNSVLNHAKAHRVVSIIEFIEANYKDSIEISDIASHVGMSASSLHEHFKSATSLSPIQFIKRLRLHNAHNLLLEGMTSSQAAYESGYMNQAQFSREFKRHFGHTPSAIKSAGQMAYM